MTQTVKQASNQSEQHQPTGNGTLPIGSADMPYRMACSRGAIQEGVPPYGSAKRWTGQLCCYDAAQVGVLSKEAQLSELPSRPSRISGTSRRTFLLAIEAAPADTCKDPAHRVSRSARQDGAYSHGAIQDGVLPYGSAQALSRSAKR